MCAVLIASDSTSRFSRSACAALADSTAKSVRSATCSSSVASPAVHCRGVLSHITRTATSVPPRTSGTQTSEATCIRA